MTSVFDAPSGELIAKVAEKLKKISEIKPPEWAKFAKTGAHKQRPPAQSDWWYIRAAAVLRAVYKLGPVGVSKLRTKYGGKRNNGMAPEHFTKGSGNIIRKILQQLEKAELIKFVKTGIHKGRVIAPKGESLLDKTAIEISGVKVKKEPKHEVKAETAEPEAKELPPEKPAKKAKNG